MICGKALLFLNKELDTVYGNRSCESRLNGIHWKDGAWGIEAGTKSARKMLPETIRLWLFCRKHNSIVAQFGFYPT